MSGNIINISDIVKFNLSTAGSVFPVLVAEALVLASNDGLDELGKVIAQPADGP